MRRGDTCRPAHLLDGPGLVRSVLEASQDIEHATRACSSAYSDYYDTNTLKMYIAGQSPAAPVDHSGGERAAHHADDRGRARLPHEHDEAMDGYPGHEHTIPTYPLYKDVIKLLRRRRGIAYTPTLIVAYGGPWAENYWYDARATVHGDRSCSASRPRRARREVAPPRRSSGAGRRQRRLVHGRVNTSSKFAGAGRRRIS